MMHRGATMGSYRAGVACTLVLLVRLAKYRRLAEESGASERIATLLVNNMGYRTLEDLENVSGAQVENKSIQAIIYLDIPLVTSSRLEN